jgi:hypothetical protein
MLKRNRCQHATLAVSSLVPVYDKLAFENAQRIMEVQYSLQTTSLNMALVPVGCVDVHAFDRDVLGSSMVDKYRFPYDNWTLLPDCFSPRCFDAEDLLLHRRRLNDQTPHLVPDPERPG